MEENKECPICGCKDIAQGKQMGQGAIMPIWSIWTGSAVISDICTECGHILSMRVERPEKFRTKKKQL